jgi:hypothetical protein
MGVALLHGAVARFFLAMPASEPRPGRMNSHLKRTRLSVEAPTGRVKRGFAVATGCSARFTEHFRAGADAKVAA